MRFKKTEISCHGYGKLEFRPTKSYWDTSDELVSALTAKGEWGEIVIDQLKDENYLLIRLVASITCNETTLSFTSEESFLQFIANLKQEIVLSAAGAPDRRWRRHDFNLCYLPLINCSCTLSKGEYEIFGIEFSEEYLRRWNHAFSLLAEFLEHTHAGTYTRITPTNPTLTPRKIQLIADMQNSGCSGYELEMFLESKVLELLRLSLARATECNESGRTELFRQDEMKRLHEAREQLIMHYVKPPSPAELAFTVGMSQSTLRRGFSKLFGCTMFEFITDLRMQHARSLVIETDLPFKVIATTIGLKSGSGFSTRFKKSFGVPPDSLRRKNSSRPQ